MATEERVRIAFEADLADMRKELAKLPEISSKEAKAMVKGLEKQYKRAEKAAKKTAKAQKSASDKTRAGFESAKQAAEGFGGAVGGSAGQVEKFARSMFEASAAIGPVGAGLVAAGLAIAGIGIAGAASVKVIVGLIDEAEELAKAMEPFEDAGVFAPIPPEALASVHDFNDALGGIGKLADRLKLVIGIELAGAFSDSAEAILVAGFAVAGMMEKMEGLGKIARVVFPALAIKDVMVENESATWASVAAWAGYGDELGKARTRAAAAMVTSGKLRTAQEDEKAASESATRAKQAAAEAERERARAIRETIKAIQDQEKARDQLASITESAAADTLTAEEKVNAAYEDRVDAIAAVMMEAGDQAAASEALAAAEARRIRDLEGLDEERAEKQKKLLEGVDKLRQDLDKKAKEAALAAVAQTLTDIDTVIGGASSAVDGFAQLQIDKIQSILDKQTAAIEQEGEKRREKREENIAGLLESGKISEAEAERRLDEIDRLEDADEKKMKKLERMAEKQALKSFRMQKAAQKAQAIIDGARAAVALIPAFSFMLAGAPAGAAAAASIATATQLAVISAQKPPDFPVGGLVADRMPGGGAASADHVNIMAQPQEGIVTGRGMDALGRDGLEAINTGGTMGGSTVVLQMDSATIAQAILSSPDLTGRIVGALGLTPGRAPVYGRG